MLWREDETKTPNKSAEVEWAAPIAYADRAACVAVINDNVMRWEEKSSPRAVSCASLSSCRPHEPALCELPNTMEKTVSIKAHLTTAVLYDLILRFPSANRSPTRIAGRAFTASNPDHYGRGSPTTTASTATGRADKSRAL
jgi:hypothetical protein